MTYKREYIEIAKTAQSVKGLAVMLGVSETTIRDWRKHYPSFAKALPIRLLDSAPEDQTLSKRYTAIVQLLANGKTPQEIGEELSYNTNSVHEALARMRDRLECDTTVQVVAEALRREWIK